MSPITFKSFLSQEMKLLRPEIAELGENSRKDPMKSNKKQ
jgi:hypothetical protein